MSFLELRGIAHRYPGAPLPTLAGVDLQVDRGRMLAVVGPSGSGKTTLLRVTAGLTVAEAGEVWLEGRPVAAQPPEERGLTVMFQQPHLFQHLDVLDNVAFGQRARRVSRRVAREAARRYLGLVGLADLGTRRPRDLSGGQQQRVALARALATERDLLLLDEPFSSLDRELRQSMHRLLGEVRAVLEPTVVMVTHDLDEAALADRVAVLVQGRVEQVGPVEELYARPASLAVARLVGGFNELPGTVVDGVHRSGWGDHALPAGCVAAGPATLLVRREHLVLADHDDPRRTGSAAVPAGVTGRVVATSRIGPRQVVEVELYGGHVGAGRVHVELAAGRSCVQSGHRVTVSLGDRSRVWAVAGRPGPAVADPVRTGPSVGT